MDARRLREIEDQIFSEGPRRVMINEHEAVPAKTARLRHGMQFNSLEIIFIRKDGWTLGAAKHLADAAEKLWMDEWAAVMIKPPTINSFDYQDWVAQGRPQWRQEEA